ncbi:hypothetical protein ACQYWQ_09030 [Streptomyces sp. P6-2-1]|uniref:hypothetical protein n=1 Tax=unclassified Streptomyces TaxID=2593676 RepID=UPI003D367A64
MGTPAQLLLSALSKRPDLPASPVDRHRLADFRRPRPARPDLSAASDPDAGLPGAASHGAQELPLTSEPPLTDTAPLTSEPPLAEAVPLTSEPPFADPHPAETPAETYAPGRPCVAV